MNYMVGGTVYRMHKLRLLQQATKNATRNATKNDYAKRKSI